jgi:hypothetical protein
MTKKSRRLEAGDGRQESRGKGVNGKRSTVNGKGGKDGN